MKYIILLLILLPIIQSSNLIKTIQSSIGLRPKKVEVNLKEKLNNQGSGITPDMVRQIQNIMSTGLLYYGDDIVENTVYLQQSLQQAYGGFWDVFIITPGGTSFTSFYQYYDQWMFTQYGRFNWYYGFWRGYP